MSSKIEWTEDTWNPLIGCDKVSTGCKNCYAIKTAWIRQHNPAMAEKYAGVVEKTANGSLNWTGKINFYQPHLRKPLDVKKPTVFFVNSMSDLFHESVSVQTIADIFAMMWLTERHTYQVLTKRPARAEFILNSEGFKILLTDACNRLHHELIKPLSGTMYFHDEVMADYPLPNVWIGTSIEDQNTVHRLDDLCKIPAKVRFISAEPLLSQLDLGISPSECFHKPPIHWVICGGESGKEARPMHPDWARSLRDQCKVAGIPFFFKQWGEYGPTPGVLHHQHPYQFPDGQVVYKCSKAQNGRMLDDCFHESYPNQNNEL